MKETPIFRNIQHVPRIWGVTYVKLFGSLGVGLVVLTVSFALANRGSAFQKVSVIVFGVVLTAVLYGISFWLDNRDPLDSNTTPFLRSEFNSQSLSLQRVTLRDKETHEVSRPAPRHQPARTKARKRAALR
ncbi:MAG: hypothetical protein L0387_17495 [Acidobacteria bacterium]|nr:hypothetical protein [Acidobacteriota bacterium]